MADCLGIPQHTLLSYEEDGSKIPIQLANDSRQYYDIGLDSIFFGKNSDLKQKFKIRIIDKRKHFWFLIESILNENL